ncbi:MAG TPA: response regulator [Thermoanaerobaculia bacterium]|jgi:DNA-binding response OmpR family regulator
MKRILIADDDPGILEGMDILLSRRYDVVTARNGEEAVARLSEGPVDLVILDLLMPLLDGESALVRLREGGFRGGVIVMSAHADRLGRTRLLGADDFLVKPFEFRELERSIERLLPRDSTSARPRAVSSCGH